MSNRDSDGAKHTERTYQPPIWVAIALTVAFIGLAIFLPGVFAVVVVLLIAVALRLFGATYPYYGGGS